MRYAIKLTALVLATANSLCTQDIPLSKILVDKESWRAIEEGAPTPWKGKIEKQTKVRSSAGHVYHIGNPVGVNSETRNGVRVIWGTKEAKLRGLKTPTALLLWPDEGHLVVAEADSAYLWAVRIEKDGSFGPGDRYYSLRTMPNEKMNVSAMVMDAGYLLYACTPLGIQVFDPTGRLSGVIPAPSKESLTAIAIGGAKGDELFVAAGSAIYARRIQGKASYTLKKEKR